jgi:iron complex transport system substrate-binding protein
MRRIEIGIAFMAFSLTWGALCSTARARESPQAQAEIAKRSVVDEVGRRVAVPTKVRRIVTLAPNLTEIVYALGAEDRLVGVSAYSDHPPQAKTKPSIGMPVNPSLEAVVGVRPDLVLATTSINFVKTVDALARLGIAVYTTDPHTVEGTLRSITDIGEVIDAQQQARSLVASLQTRLDALKAKLSHSPTVRALFIVWDQPLQSIGDNTFIADALRWAGAESAIHTKQNWPLISLEEVVKLDPDYIVYAENQMDENAANNSSAPADLRAAIARHLEQLRSQPVWSELTAVREGHVAVVDDEIQVPAPGLVDTIEQLARELHPDAFTGQIHSHSLDQAPPELCAWRAFPEEVASCAP